MSEATLPPERVREIERALARYAMQGRRLVTISAPAKRPPRAVYRIDLEDGRTIKARRLDDADAARRLFALGTGIDPAFAPLLGQEGPVVLEAWIEGRALTAADDAPYAAEAGALLARLHATPRPDMPARVATRVWRERADADLRTLAAAGALAPAEARRLGAALARHDPAEARAVLVHGDFCAENMLIDGARRLRVIDNEWLAIAPAGFDLARTRSRWPLSEPAWARLLDAYRAGGGDGGPLAFWTVVAALKRARIALRHGPERSAAAVAALRAVASRVPGK